MLGAFCAQCDPNSGNVVSTSEFRAGLMEMNRQLTAAGEETLTDHQVGAICEIASGGSDRVQYRDFLQSLKTVDTHKRTQLAELGRIMLGESLPTSKKLTA